MNQKYKVGHRVALDDQRQAIIAGSYHELHGGGNVTSFAVIVLDEDGRPCDWRAWCDEDQMTLVSSNRLAGLELMDFYHESRAR